MLSLKRWEPFAELSAIENRMEELFKRTLGGFGEGLASRYAWKGEWYPLVETFREGENLILRADLPGIDPKDVDISITGKYLSIKGERKTGHEVKEGEYFVKETSYGRFERTVELPEGVDATNVHATCKNGVLELSMPVKKAALPLKVKIETEGGWEKKEAKKAA